MISQRTIHSEPDSGGHFGPYGGRFVPEVLMSPLSFLWILAVGLMSFSLATMVALISARVLRKQGKARRAARRAIVLPELVHHIGGLTGDELHDGNATQPAAM